MEKVNFQSALFVFGELFFVLRLVVEEPLFRGDLEAPRPESLEYGDAAAFVHLAGACPALDGVGGARPVDGDPVSLEGQCALVLQQDDAPAGRTVCRGAVSQLSFILVIRITCLCKKLQRYSPSAFIHSYRIPNFRDSSSKICESVSFSASWRTRTPRTGHSRYAAQCFLVRGSWCRWGLPW